MVGAPKMGVLSLPSIETSTVGTPRWLSPSNVGLLISA